MKELEDLSERKSRKTTNKYHSQVNDVIKIKRDMKLLEVRVKEKE